MGFPVKRKKGEERECKKVVGLVTLAVLQKLNDVLNDAVTQHDHMFGLHEQHKITELAVVASVVSGEA